MKRCIISVDFSRVFFIPIIGLKTKKTQHETAKDKTAGNRRCRNFAGKYLHVPETVLSFFEFFGGEKYGGGPREIMQQKI